MIAQAAVRRDIGLGEWLTDPQTWTGPGGVFASLSDTLLLCGAVVAVAALLAVPTAALLAHRRRAELSAAWVVSVGRAIPAFALAGLLVPISLRSGWGFEPWPIFIALLLMALPPMFLNTYTGVKGAEPGAVDAARAMGFTERAILVRVELALAAAVVFGGVRVAAVQVVATEPIRAFLGGDGLGRFVRDGLGQNNDTLVLGGAILVAGLAGATALALGAVERFALPRGVRRLRQNRQTGGRP